MTEPKLPGRAEGPAKRPLSSPLAACGAILALLAVVGLARGYELGRDPPEIIAEAPREPGPAAPEIRRLRDERSVDVNRASADELRLLPRIGPTLAARIVEERERGGPFRSLADLRRVRGIGPRTIEGLAGSASVAPNDPSTGRRLAQ